MFILVQIPINFENFEELKFSIILTRRFQNWYEFEICHPMIVGENPRESIGGSSLNFCELVNIHRMDWRKSTQLSSIICRESGVWGVSFEFRS